MSQLGCYYLHVFYPSHLFLETGRAYIFLFQGRHFSVLISQNLKSLIINDFNNRIIVDEEASKEHSDPTIPKKHKLENNEISIAKGLLGITLEGDVVSYMLDSYKHLYKEFYYKNYTEIIIAFETEPSTENQALAEKALNYFINSYRTVTDDVLTLPLNKTLYVSNIFKEYFYKYTNEELSLTSEQRLTTSREAAFGLKTVRMPYWNTQGKTFDTNENINSQNLKVFFNEQKTPHAYHEYILKAREELYIHNNYKYSFIESWTTLEVAITSILKTIKLKKGISKKKIEDLEGEVGISYLLNIELPLVHENNDARFKDLIGRVDSIRKIRNKVIHENRDINQEEAGSALSIAIEFLNYFGFKKY